MQMENIFMSIAHVIKEPKGGFNVNISSFI